MLVLLACCDKSTIVALEAIKGLAGASFPTATSIAAADGSNGSSSGSSSRRPPVLPDEHVEADVRVKCSMGWQLLLAHAGDEAPEYQEPAAAAGAGAPAMVKQSTMARCVPCGNGGCLIGVCLGSCSCMFARVGRTLLGTLLSVLV
jgi:hypothetical protein